MRTLLTFCVITATLLGCGKAASTTADSVAETETSTDVSLADAVTDVVAPADAVSPADAATAASDTTAAD